MKPQLFISVCLVVLVLACASLKKHTDGECERVTLSYKNKHDLSKVIFIERWVYDTIANKVRGIVIDRKTLAPLANAKIVMRQDSNTFTDLTDSIGRFSIFSWQFIDTWSLTASHDDYTCLIVDSVLVGGGQELTIKLKMKD